MRKLTCQRHCNVYNLFKKAAFKDRNSQIWRPKQQYISPVFSVVWFSPSMFSLPLCHSHWGRNLVGAPESAAAVHHQSFHFKKMAVLSLHCRVIPHVSACSSTRALIVLLSLLIVELFCLFVFFPCLWSFKCFLFAILLSFPFSHFFQLFIYFSFCFSIQ